MKINKIILTILILSIITLVFSGCGGSGGITTPETPSDSLNAIITATPTSGEAPLEVAFDASESSAAQGNEIVSYEWDFRDSKTGEGGTVYHGFDSPGNYTVILTISDNKGSVDTSSVVITVFQPTETVIEREFDSQSGTEFDTGTGLKIIIPPTSIEGQVNLEVKYNSSPSQSASDFMNLHSSYSISLIPQKGFTEKEITKLGMTKNQESAEISFIFDIPEDVDPQSMAILEWRTEGWCLAGTGDIGTIEQLGGVLSSNDTQISIEIPNFSNYSKCLNSKDLQNTLGSIKFSLCNFANNLTANIPICPSILVKPEENHDYYIEKKIEFRSLDLGILGYGRGICYKVGVKNSEDLIGDFVWEQPYTSDLIKIIDPFGKYLIPTNDWEKPGVLTLKYGIEGGECIVWLEANQGAIVKKWLLSTIPYVGPADLLWRNIVNISDAFNHDVLGPFFGHSIGGSALIKEIREMIKEVAMELTKEGLDSFIPGLTLGVSIGELNAGIITYQETVYNKQNPCNYKEGEPGYWEWRIIVLPIKNNPPTANAGPDQTLQVGKLVNLDGTASYDDDGDALSYKWTQIKGPETVNLPDSNISKPVFTPTKVGVYEFELIVNDGKDNSEPDNVIVNVTGSTILPPTGFSVSSYWNTVSPGFPSMSLSWNAVSGATGYEMWVRPSGGSYVYLGPRDAPYVTFNSNSLPGGARYVSGTTYYFKIRTVTASGTSDFTSEVSCVAAAPSIGQVQLSNPSNGATISTSTVVLSWNSASGATGYEVVYDTSSSFTNPIGWSVSGTSQTTGTLTNGTTYYWRVRAFSGSQYYSWSSVWSFTKSNVILPPTGLSVSSSWDTTSPGFPKMVLSWNAVSGATGYEMWVRPSGGSYVYLGPRDAPYVTFNSNSLPGGARYVSGTTYYFKIRTVTASGTSDFTSEVSCVAAATPPPSLGQVQLSSPGNGFTLPPMNITFIWNSVSNATKYEIIIYNPLGQVALDQTTTNIHIIVALGTEETITWKVRAGDNNGNWGAWSSIWSLTIKK